MTPRPFLILMCALVLGSCASNAAGPTNTKAPDSFNVTLDLSTGPVVIHIDRADAPLGVDRFYNLVQAKYFDGARFFRVIPGFVAQFGMNADPKVNKAWDVPIKDDPVKHTNMAGSLVFAATSRPNSRTTQMFINLGDNANLDQMGFAPIGRVMSGMDNVAKINPEYKENPDQEEIEKSGNAYLIKEFPRLDYIKTARVTP
jgi:peptidyl-prolyl cis-trans isomerase A (cyclophilin A)